MTVTLRLRLEELKKMRTLADIKTDAKLAARMDMDAATVSRVLRGKQIPGPRFMAQLVSCFPGYDLDDLFEIIESDAA